MSAVLFKIILDVVLIAILVLGVILGLKRGFVKTVAKPVKFVASLVCAYNWCGAFGAKFIAPSIQAPITLRISTFLEQRSAELSANVSESVPTILKMAAGLFGIDIETVASGAGAEGVAEALANKLTSPVINIISSVLAFIVLYIGCSLAFSAILWLINLFCTGGIVGIANKILGLVFNTAFAVIIVWLLSGLVSFVFGQAWFVENVSWAREFSGGFVYNFFNNFDPLDILLGF